MSESSNPSAAQTPVPPAQGEPPWLHKATFACALLAGIWSVFQFAVYTRRQWNVEQEQRELDLNLTKAELLAVTGQIYSPERYFNVGMDRLPLRPVFIDITNSGKTPVKLEKIEFRVFVADPEAISRLVEYPRPTSDITLTSEETPSRSPRSGSGRILGVIDYSSDKWVEIRELSKIVTPENGLIPASQIHCERLHLITPADQSLLTKVVATVTTKNSTITWFGFVDSEMCQPGSIPPAPPE